MHSSAGTSAGSAAITIVPDTTPFSPTGTRILSPLTIIASSAHVFPPTTTNTPAGARPSTHITIIAVVSASAAATSAAIVLSAGAGTATAAPTVIPSHRPLPFVLVIVLPPLAVAVVLTRPVPIIAVTVTVTVTFPGMLALTLMITVAVLAMLSAATMPGGVPGGSSSSSSSASGSGRDVVVAPVVALLAISPAALVDQVRGRGAVGASGAGGGAEQVWTTGCGGLGERRCGRRRGRAGVDAQRRGHVDVVVVVEVRAGAAAADAGPLAGELALSVVVGAAIAIGSAAGLLEHILQTGEALVAAEAVALVGLAAGEACAGVAEGWAAGRGADACGGRETVAGADGAVGRPRRWSPARARGWGCSCCRGR